MICKTTLDRLGKAAFNALTPEEQTKYIAASKIMAVVSSIIKRDGNVNGAALSVGNALTDIGIAIGGQALILLTKTITGKEAKDITGAVSLLAEYIGNAIDKLIDQLKHEIAAKLAVLFGVNENPGILGAIMEWVFKAIVKPKLA